jgi:type I restriction enzyme M protein
MSTEGIPKWLQIRYSVLWEHFRESPFRFEQASELLVNKNKDDWAQIPVILSELKKSGWLNVESDPNDLRKKIYRLVSREKAIRNALTIKGDTLTRADIEGILKRAADLIRTRVDYKFILILLFLKRISDKWEIEFEEAKREALEDGLSEKEADEEARKASYHDFDLPEEYLWDNIRRDVSRLPEKMSKALKVVAERNVELKDVVDSVDFIQFTSSNENAEILRQLVELFSEKKLHSVSPDILGDAYEWILRYFAPDKAKEGEIYTPREVIRLLIELLDPKPGESTYDPACGSAGMLIASYNHVREKNGEEKAKQLFLFGQEANQKTLALAKMNMYIHDIRDSNLVFGDTLLYPKFKEEESIKKFDVVIANPPWNQDGYDEDTIKNGEFWQQRFKYGFVPKQSADWAWIQHMIASAANNDGRVGIVIDNGCLFRSGKEGAIRQRIIEKDLLECVILLPEKLFYNTGAPGAILVFRINKPGERKGKVLFINASNEFEKHPEVRKLNRLSEDNIKRIARAYQEYEDTSGFSGAVSVEQMKANDWNLNVSLYVNPEEKEEEIDIIKEFEELRDLEKQRQETLAKIEDYVSKLRNLNG